MCVAIGDASKFLFQATMATNKHTIVRRSQRFVVFLIEDVHLWVYGIIFIAVVLLSALAYYKLIPLKNGIVESNPQAATPNTEGPDKDGPTANQDAAAKDTQGIPSGMQSISVWLRFHRLATATCTPLEYRKP